MPETGERRMMTVKEAGRLGGTKGGETTREKYGNEFYREIGQKGAQKVKDLIALAKRAESGS